MALHLCSRRWCSLGMPGLQPAGTAVAHALCGVAESAQGGGGRRALPHRPHHRQPQHDGHTGEPRVAEHNGCEAEDRKNATMRSRTSLVCATAWAAENSAENWGCPPRLGRTARAAERTKPPGRKANGCWISSMLGVPYVRLAGPGGGREGGPHGVYPHGRWAQVQVS